VKLSDRFEILGELGQGGMASVRLVVDRQTGEQSALKILHPHLAARPAARQRLREELAIIRHLSHPAILPVLGLIETEDALALQLPAIRGGTLQERVERDGPLSAADLSRLLTQLGGALLTAHRSGILHRDVTPNNVLLDGDRFLLADFGLARMADGRTATTTAMGTPGYAAPEVWSGQWRDPRSDAFSLGAVLYFAATGRPPYGEQGALDAMKRQLDGRHAPIDRHDLPPALTDTIDALLSPMLEARPGVEEALDLLPPPVPAAGWRIQRTQLGAGISMLLLIGVGWFQDLGSFLLSTIIEGHAIPRHDIFEMSQGVAGLLLLPLALLPAIIGGVLGARTDTERRLAPWVGLAVLASTNLLYAMFAGVILPEMGMRGTADMFGTMLFHLGGFLPIAAATVMLCQPWRGLRVSHSPAVQPLPDRTLAALGQLSDTLSAAPQAIRVDLSDTVRTLREDAEALIAEQAALLEGRQGLQPDPIELIRLEDRLTRARTLGEDTVAALQEALRIRQEAAAEAEAIDTRLTRIAHRLLQIRAAAAAARRAMLRHPEDARDTLGELQERVRHARAAVEEVGATSAHDRP
jgi:hypothetical protein